ncbi:hypothetical protein J4E93_008406 [Alternaria ventricosa]|uniref:uncharacterized protein n=1 Tax=Alternaria ventricosa TaxID=1187951 RepID=UPI0020C24C9F|nr:uncharacterized protein J4E93_008406 [Alternaria ventricosa]KAI4640813.1 hypothetical protein J4E93_008406 [Alternaria ventricosa]
MGQPAGDDVLNRKSLSLMYRNYKKETEYIAGWLAWTSQQCGYLRTAMEAETQAPRKRGKAGKARKPAKQQSKNDTKVQYAINVSEFKGMAEHIASFNPKIEVPAALQKVFERVISARNEMADWFRKEHSSDQGSNMRHSYFINVLENAAAILKPLTPEAPVVAENIKLQNRFAGLAVEETDPLNELIVEVQEKQLPDIHPLPLEQDEEGLEDDFFFAIATFLDDISKVRKYITGQWHEYRRTGEGLTRTSVLSNTAVDLVRSAEHQFDQMLSRPKR